MSGVIVPANIIVEPFGRAADPDTITLPIPIPDQIAVVPGRASFEKGFPEACFLDPVSEGGVPPFGEDFNGLLFTLSAYCALLQAGQLTNWNNTAQTAFGGYKIGARFASTVTAGRVWVNLVDGNVLNPDVNATGWASEDPFVATSAPAAGTINNMVLPGASDYALDIDTTAGAVNISGIVAQRNGQRVFLSCKGANLLQVLASNGGSLAVNRIRAATDLGIVTNQTLTLQFFSGLNAGVGGWLLT